MPYVELVYCTHNDFTEDSLLASIQQEYTNCKTIILDDSNDPVKISEVQKFAQAHNLQVIRRDTRRGYKAGNLNNYLASCQSDYFVVLDSDEIIPPDFISKALPYFQDSKIAIVQGNHIAANDKNGFMQLFSLGVRSHWHTYQSIKHSFGFLSFLGHGAIVKTSVYKEVGGFPELVAEDLCFSIELRRCGYFVAFAPEIVCFEQYPVNYLAFKKRHTKWIMGNMEFIKKYTLRILFSSMAWYEKLDLFLFTYSLPLSILFFSYMMINVVVFPLLRFNLDYPLVMLIPTVILLFSPMLNDIIYHFPDQKWRVIIYAVNLIFLYGSLFYLSFKSSLVSFFGDAKFSVTPKVSRNITILRAIGTNGGELIFGLLLLVVSQYLSRSVLSVALVAFPSLSSVYLTRLSNKKNAVSSKYNSPVPILVPDTEGMQSLFPA